jgi:hypothetical protein
VTLLLKVGQYSFLFLQTVLAVFFRLCIYSPRRCPPTLGGMKTTVMKQLEKWTALTLSRSPRRGNSRIQRREFSRGRELSPGACRLFPLSRGGSRCDREACSLNNYGFVARVKSGWRNLSASLDSAAFMVLWLGALWAIANWLRVFLD